MGGGVLLSCERGGRLRGLSLQWLIGVCSHRLRLFVAVGVSEDQESGA